MGTYPLSAECATATFSMILGLTARYAYFCLAKQPLDITPSVEKFPCRVVLFFHEDEPIAFVIG